MKLGRQKFLGFSLLLVFTLILSACGGSSKEPTPTPVDPNLVAAQAIATFAMGLTQTAFAQPTATYTLEPTATNTLPPVTFGALTTNTSAAPVNTCDVSVFVTDVTIPDGTPTAPGQTFVKTWRVQNSGTCTWTATYKAVFTGSGNGPLGGVTTPIGKTVKPGDPLEISISFTAPTTAGDYVSWWKLQNDKGEFFGTAFSVAIKVVGAPAATGTATATPTETPTATP